MTLYDFTDAGLYGDSTLGHQHVRECLADALSKVEQTRAVPLNDRNLALALVGELDSELSDDLSEEDEAVELLNKYTDQNFRWDFLDGDLMLMHVDEWRECND